VLHTEQCASFEYDLNFVLEILSCVMYAIILRWTGQCSACGSNASRNPVDRWNANTCIQHEFYWCSSV